MKILLVAVNAKYIHSNLGIYSLKAYARQQLEADPPRTQDPVTIELAEYTINHQLDACLQDIYRRKPDVIGFSCYIWNIESIRSLAADIRKLLPHVPLWLGGPEVSYDARKVLQDMPFITGVMKGEGEETFAQLVRYYVDNGTEDPADCGKVRGQGLSRLTGLTYRGPDGAITDTGIRPVMDLSRIPFSYDCIKLEELEHRIIYYESSRGCPFSCSYCLSSIDKQIRFRNLDLVKEELLFFLNAGVPQVKFVDRTFNCKKSHAMAIWRWIQEHDNGVTNFHFEIAADLLGEEEMELLAGMRPGLVQLEIGVQTTNVQALEAIRRKTDIDEIRRITSRINAGRNVHQHLDLIAGLPYEGMESFQKSFDDVYSMEPEQLQLGFLKVLKGSYMEEKAPDYGLVYSSTPPYEVLSTRWLSYDRILELKTVEDMVEVHYNSRQFTCTLKALEKEFPSPYQMFLAMGEYYQKHGLTGMNHSRIARYEILFAMIEEYLHGPSVEAYRDRLTADLYLRENVKSRPSFARDQAPYKSKIRDFFISEEKNPRYLAGYEGFDSRQMSKMAHVEAMGDKTLVLFDYRNRDPLTYNARACVLELN
ncbi:B12-binding domain-containing radical SAM protein [Enterocloster citroniae]|uniref:B12-binding domain-containing radical SAM protein n=1 Tax=Enterocloster citroniae TaxID=358743 RepID=UPI0018994995|nr:B12-binding domain-containing radical SAM protein [Enterocloster citroniae]